MADPLFEPLLVNGPQLLQQNHRIFHHMIAFKSLNYPMKDIELVLMHEGTHIVRRDNLGKKLALLIVLVNWFNPILRLYLNDLDAWGDISCDIHVCSHFLGGHARK